MKKSDMAQRIRAARKRAGLTQNDLAAHFNIHRSAVTLWETRDPKRRTRPDMSRLEEFARITRTPVWWLLSDEVDPDEPWPEVVEENPALAASPVNAWQGYVRAFWSSVSLDCRAARHDLWDADIWEPRPPGWLAPLTPDVLTKRSAVQLLSWGRPEFPRVAQAMSSLVSFEIAQGTRYDRKAVLVWYPPEDPNNHAPVARAYLRDLDRLYERAELLGHALGVTYYVVRTREEAAAYLIQIL